MILCICQSVTDRDVDAAIRGGARSVAAVTRACGAARDCGGCRPAKASEAGNLILETRIKEV